MRNQFAFSFFALPPRVVRSGFVEVQEVREDDWTPPDAIGDDWIAADAPLDDAIGIDMNAAPDDDPDDPDEPEPDRPNDGGHPRPVPLPPAPIGPSGPAIHHR